MNGAAKVPGNAESRVGRPRLLDLCSGGGGCSVGFTRAGFTVYGCDKLPHPDYPFAFHLGDAIDVLDALLAGEAVDFVHPDGRVEWLTLADFDVIAGSPPCQKWSTITPGANRDGHPDLIAPMRERLLSWGGLYVIENVEGARRELRHPIKLCGSAFDLRVQRHRYFETNLATLVLQPGCSHAEQGRPTGVYGDHPQNDHEYRRPDGTRRGAKATSIVDAQDALGIDWMTEWDDLTDAIPPAYTEWLGLHLISQLEAVAA